MGYEVPELRIQQIAGQYIAVLGEAQFPLPTPDRLKEESIEVCESQGDDEAAEALRLCDLSYDVAHGGGFDQCLEVVIAAQGRFSRHCKTTAVRLLRGSWGR